MASDKDLEILQDRKTKHIEDNLFVDRLQSEALEQNPEKVVAEVEQNRLTEALRGRVKGKLKSVKAAQEKQFSSAKGCQKKPKVNAESEVPLDEGFEFFTSTFEDHPKMKDTNQNIEQKSLNSNHQNICDLNEQTPLLVHVKEMLLTELLEIKAPECNFNNVEKEKQWNQLFFSSTSPVIHSHKLPINILPRFLEEEGLYTPRKPYIPRNMYHRMENRLQQEGGKGWFEESGEIVSLPSPIKESSHQMASFPTVTQLKRKYRKAVQPQLENSAITKSDDHCKMHQLDLNISSIIFSHHSLFNCEHVLAIRLLDIYECFQKRQQQNVTHLLSEKLKALISATKLAEKNLKTSQLSTSTLKDYRSQIRNTKILLDKEQRRDNSLIQSMLKVWKQMKSVRKQQGFISTSIKLQFQRSCFIPVVFLAGLEALTLMSDPEKRQILHSELDEYETKISDDEKVNCLDSSHTSTSSKDLAEQEKPFFMPRLTFIPEITPANLCPLEEQKRRENIKMEKYFIKIYYNNKLVSCTPEVSLCQDFKVIFEQLFRIQVLNWSESLQLEIFESNKKTTLLAKIYLPLPNYFILKSKDILDEVEFSCEQQVKSSDGTVGSNVSFFLGENEAEELCILTSGKLMYSLSWAVDDNGIPLPPTFQPAHISCNSLPQKGTGIWQHADLQKLIDGAKDINIDPNDPCYSDLFELIMRTESQKKCDSKHFRFEHLQEEFNFVTAEYIENCKRFQLLHLRNLGQLGLYCFQQIPLFDGEIPDTIFQERGNQLEKDMMTDMDPISAQRNRSANFVRMMRKQVAKQIVTIRCKFNLSDLVSDYEEIISVSQLSNAIFKLGERRRHLKPQRKERRKVPAQAVSDGDVKLLIRILRAYNIPARKTPTFKDAAVHSPSYLPNRTSRGRHILSGNPSCIADPLSEVTVHPFVEVKFQKTVYQTSTADGSHPCWNEELQLDFNSPGHDYTFSGLSKIKDNININIFDEFLIEKHEICGTFQINMPPVVLGYTWSKTYVPPKEEYLGQNLKEYSFLTIFATIEPQLYSAENILELDKFADHEAETLLQRAHFLKQTWKAMFPKRRIITSVFNNQGRNILVTKYIASLNPPQLLLDMYPEDPNSTSDLISRFVSLIPCIQDTVEENDDVDIWMTSEHCIDLAVGNKEEHAVLLCNYLLYMGKKAWVLLGTSVLEGKVSYVVTEENGTYFLWNPLSGQCYKQFDAFCPLQSVDCLINWKNVWFNIQHNSSPMCTSFDISKECFWKQLLPYNIQNSKMQTVQPEKIFYVSTDESLVDELQTRIERTLKNKIMEWRSHLPTRWHRQCTSVLRQILPKLEFRNDHKTQEKEKSYLEAFQEHYWVTGFPIQMPYLDMQTVIEAVYQTGIHSSEIPSIEFALAVSIHPYPNKILSVWIYLVSLVRHQ